MAYDHSAIEPYFQKVWDEQQTFVAQRRAGRRKYYVLDMFPYPSGSGLHVGHPEGYTATDILARYHRMRGFDVLHPMGWDAFGLPAEQYAIQTGTHPAVTTQSNIAVFRRQLKALGFSYDWSRELSTTDPDYVRFTQWIFLKLFERGLAFQSEIPVNWCEALGTVLANEEVIDGRSERGHHPVERRPLRQWQLKITRYADRLAEELEGLDWPETRQKQRDWIGRSEGASVRFSVPDLGFDLEVFTTRPDTLFGATYMVVAPDHPKIRELTTNAQRNAVEEYVRVAVRKSDLERTSTQEKTGVFTGSYAQNPLSEERIPIYTGDYVLGAYGTGAIMAVPAHDERDFAFARKFELPIVEVVSPDGHLHEGLAAPFTGDGIAVRSGLLDGLPTKHAKEAILDHLEQSGIGRRKVSYKLRDWVFSRQRYWGEPIPIYFPVQTAGDPRRGDGFEIDYSRPIAVSEAELPLRLPELDDYRPGDPAGALTRALDWRFFQKDGEWFARETNTMPQWAGSCWYYLRYLDPHNETEILSQKAYDDWMPVDLYVGGSEHAVLHLLYARFWHKVLFDCGVVKHPEPFQKLVHQGMILGMVYRYYVEVDTGKIWSGDDDTIFHHKGTKEFEARFLVAKDVVWRDGRPYHPDEPSAELVPLPEKMSKARGNVINPDDVVRDFGADSLRLYEMFMGPLEQVKPWQTAGIQGVRRFLDRVDTVSRRASEVPLLPDTEKQLHRTIKKVTEDILALRFNTAISTMMMFVNHLTALSEVPRAAVIPLLVVLCPFAPHLAEALFAELGGVRSLPAADGADSGEPAPCLSLAFWPSWDERLCVDDVVEVAVQVNGKVRSRALLPREAAEDEARALALAAEGMDRQLAGKTIKKFIYVPGRICNFIVG